jgi:EAL domain-containing protein (putative c-di-GMP-specific phosphodiesterase class I)
VFEHEGKTLTVSLAIGICPFSAGLGDAGAMLNAAERAMTDSRAPGSDQTRIGVFHPTRPKSTTDAQQTLTQLIRDALKSEDFQLLFQPIVALQGDSDEAFQALLRLRGPDGKLYTAAEILPLAEREGLSAEVDRWVVSRCLLVMAERQRQLRPVRLFVSQSMEAALDSSRTGWLRQLLETRRLSGEMLVLEFKLQEVLAHLNDFAAFANGISELGVSISVSMFDVKENSLQLLDRFGIAYIKLAARYGGENLRDDAIRDELRTIVTVAHHHDAKVIASRIEDAQSASQLWNVGIDYLQGDFVQQARQDLVFDFNATTA